MSIAKADEKTAVDLIQPINQRSDGIVYTNPGLNIEFNPTIIQSGRTSTFTVRLYNANGFALTSAAWTDTLTNGMTIASIPNLRSSCGNVSDVDLTSEIGKIKLTKGTIPARVGVKNGSCYVSVDVTSTTLGNTINTISALALSAQKFDDPTVILYNQTSASATLRVNSILPPTVSKTFSPNTRYVGSTSTLSIVIRNPDTTYDLHGVSITDTLPSGVTVVSAASSQCGGTVSIGALSKSITLTGGLVPKTVGATPSSCTVTAVVTSALPGIYTNLIPANAIRTDEGVTNAGSASAPLNYQDVGVSKSFNPINFKVGGHTTLSIVLTNPTSQDYSGVAITDTLPAGLSVYGTPTASQCSGSVTGSGRVINYSGGSLLHNTACIVQVDVTSNTAGTYTNTIPVGALTVTIPSGVTNNLAASANLTVYGDGYGLSGRKTFSVSNIAVGAVAKLNIYITAPADVDITGFSLRDALPAGLKVAAVPNAGKNASCQGGTFAPLAGDTLLVYSAGRIDHYVNAASECNLWVDVTSDIPGDYPNIISSSNISNDQGNNISSNLTATISVGGLTVTKAFYPDGVAADGVSTLTVTLINTNTRQLDNVTFEDLMPGTTADGVVFAPFPKQRTTCGAGNVLAPVGGQTLSMTGGTIPGQVGGVPGICTIVVDVQGKMALAVNPTYNNTVLANKVTGLVHGTEITLKNPVSNIAPLKILPISIGVLKKFEPDEVTNDTVSKLTITLDNPTAVAMVGITFTDNLAVKTNPDTGAIIGHMYVVSPANVSVGTCGGSVSIAAERYAFTFSGGTLAAHTTCEISLDVTQDVIDNLTNTIGVGAVTSLNGATNTQPAEWSLIRLDGASVSKTFITNPILSGSGNESTVEITIKNTNIVALTGMSLVDLLPAGMTVVSAISDADSCTDAVITHSVVSDPDPLINGRTRIQMTGGSLAASEGSLPTTCKVKVKVTAPAKGTYANCIDMGGFSALAGEQTLSNTFASCDSLTVNTVIVKPVVTKSFTPDVIAAGTTSDMRIHISSANFDDTLTGVSFTDTLQDDLTVASLPNPVQCGGLVSVGHSPETITLTGGVIAPLSACDIWVSVTSSTGGVHNNSTGSIATENGVSGDTASATLTVIEPPVITKAFAANTSPTTLTFTITNPLNNTLPLTGVAFSDVFPAGIKVAAPLAANASAGCGITPLFSPLANDSSLVFSDGTIAVGGTCTVTVNVVALGGTYTNTTSKVSSSNGGTGNAASANLTITGPGLLLTKATSSTSFQLGGSIDYSYTLKNTGDMILYPPFEVSDNKIAAGTKFACNSQAATSLGLGASIDCTNTYTPVTATDVSNRSVTNTATASAKDAETSGADVFSNESSVTVKLAELSLIKRSSTLGYLAAGNSISYQYTLTNTGEVTLYPPFQVSDNKINGGTKFTCNAQAATSLVPGANLTCSATYTVVAADLEAPFYVLNSATGFAKDKASAGTDVNSAPKSVKVYMVVPPSIVKVFTPNKVAVGATSTLKFTITNPSSNLIPLTGVSFTDDLPTNLLVASDPLAAQCGGTVSANSTMTRITFTGGTVFTDSTCDVEVPVTSNLRGTYDNLSSNVSSTNGGSGSVKAQATLFTVAPPTIYKSFSPTALQINETSRLTFTLSNPNPADILNAVAFVDNLPNGQEVASPAAVDSTCGAFTATAGDKVLNFSNGVLAASSSCTISLDIKATLGGTLNNTTNAITSTEGGTGSPSNTAPLNVVMPPVISKVFSPSSVPITTTYSTLSFSLVNLNPDKTLSGVGFSDTFPSGLAVWSTPASSTSGCGSPTFAPASGDTSLSFGNAIIAPATTCTVSVRVYGTTQGLKVNTTSEVSSFEGGAGPASDAANLVVVAPPAISKAFSPKTIRVGDTSTLTFHVTSSDLLTTISGLAFTDGLPAGLQVAATPAKTVTNCGSPTFAPNAGSTTLTVSGASVAPGVACVISVDVTSTTGGIKNNTSSTVTATNAGSGSAATDSLTVISAPTLSKAFTLSAIPINGSTSLTFTISNPNSTTDLTGITFSDTFPSGLEVAAPLTSQFAPECGADAEFKAPFAAGNTSFVVQKVAVARASSCTVSVNVKGTSAGTHDNTTGVITSTESNPGTTSNKASLTVVIPPTISKAFSAVSVPLGITYFRTLTFSLKNDNLASTLNGVGFTDALPSGLVVWTTPSASSVGCGSPTFAPASGDTSLTFSDGTILAGATCTVSVRVYGTSQGSKDNTTSAITSTDGGSGLPSNTANLLVIAPPAISKAFSPKTIKVGETSTLTFTLTSTDDLTSLTGVGFSDSLPVGLKVADLPAASVTNCGFPVYPFLAGDTTLTVSDATLTPGLACLISVDITATAGGIKDNLSEVVTSTNGGAGNTASDTLTVISAPTVSKAFAASTIPINGSTSLTFTISNPNTSTDLTGITFGDTFPSGLEVAAPLTYQFAPGCGVNAEFTAPFVAGDKSFVIQKVALARASACTVSVNVKGTMQGKLDNITGVITSTESNPGTTSNTASLTVMVPPTITKAFSPASIPVGSANYTTLTFSLINPNTDNTLNVVSFTDDLPAGLAVWTTPTVSTLGCGTPTFAPTFGATSLTFTNGSILKGATCTVSVRVYGTAQGSKDNTTSVISSTEGGTGLTSNTANLVVIAPPAISKAFSPKTIRVGDTSTLTFTIDNTDVLTTLTGVGFTDNLLPLGLQVAATPAESVTGCGSATFIPAAGNTSLTFSVASVTPDVNCVVSVDVVATVGGIKDNTSSVVTSSNGGSGNTAADTLTVISAPTVSKAFAVGAIPITGSTTLTFTIRNLNTTTDLTGITFGDTFPAGLEIANPPAASAIATDCGAAAVFNPVPVAGATSLGIEGVSLLRNTSCTVSVNVKGTLRGVLANTTGIITSIESNPGTTSNTASLTVVAPPTISKAFSVASIPLSTTYATLTFSLVNPNTGTTLTGVAFTDSLPAGLAVWTTPTASSAGCGTPTFAPLSGATSLTFSNGSILSGATCTVSVRVRGTTQGSKDNTTSVVSSSEGGTGTTSNTANLIVVAPPAISKAFSPKTIRVGDTSTLTFTVTSTDILTTLTGVGFTDNLLSLGLQVAATPAKSVTNCGSPTFNPAAGNTLLTITGASVVPGVACLISVDVTATTGGIKANTSSVVTSTNGGNGGTASDTLTVILAPTVSKAFALAAIPINGSTTLTFTIRNLNTTTDLSGITFGDSFPAGLEIANPPAASAIATDCGAAAKFNPVPVAGAASLGIEGVSLLRNTSCTVSVNVKGTTRAILPNTTGVITSTESNPGTTSNTASLTVVAPPTINKAFAVASIPLTTTFTTLTFSVVNPNTSTTLTGVAFTDALPAGLAVWTTPSVSTTGCGTPSFAPFSGATSLTFSSGTILANATCTVSVRVYGTTRGSKNNTTSVISSTEGGTGTTSNTANIVVVAPPAISKVFGSEFVKIGETPSLTFTITNPNIESNTSLTGVNFTDTLPTGLRVAAIPAAQINNCGSATFNPAAPDTILTFSGATVAAGVDCVVSVNIESLTGGIKDNTSSVVGSTNGGSGNTASDTLTVNSFPTLSKAFAVSSLRINGTTSLTFTIRNPNVTTDLTGITFSDAFPSGLQIANPPAASPIATDCGAGAKFNPLPAAGDLSVSVEGIALLRGTSCTVSVNVTPVTQPTKNNTSGKITSIESGEGETSNTASLIVVVPPTISKAFSVASIPLSTTYATLTFTLANPNPSSTLNGVAFTDALPSGLAVWTTPTASTSGCGSPSFGPASGAASLTFSSGTILANSTCTVSVRVYGTSKGSKDNTTSTVTSTEGGTGSVSNTANIVVLAPPVISKVFSPDSVKLNDNPTLTFTISNPNTDSSIALTGVGFTDSLPTGLQVAAIPSVVVTNCGAPTFNPLAADTSLTFSGATVAAGLDCVVSVNILAQTVGIKDNTSTAVVSTNGGSGNTAADTLSVNLSPTVSKAFGVSTIQVNGTTSLTFSISNPNTVTDLTGIAFSDTFPAGLQVASPLSYNIAPACGTNAAFSPALAAGALSLSIQGVDLAHGAACTVSVDVTPTSMPTKDNTTGIITSNESGPGTTSNTASLKVVIPPTISKAFSVASIPLNTTYATLSFTLVNPNPDTTLNGVAFTDALPSGLVVWTTPSASTSAGCGTPSFGPASGDTSLTYSNGSIAPGVDCVVSVRVYGTIQGSKNNTTSAITSTEGGTGISSNTANIVVVPSPIISKVFSPDAIRLNENTTLTFTISNPNTDLSTILTGVGFTDNLPSGLQVAAIPSVLVTNCGAPTFNPLAGDTSLDFSGASVATGLDCVVSVNILANTVGIKDNTSEAVVSANGGTGNTAVDSLSVNLSPTVSKAFGDEAIKVTGATSMTFIISNPNTVTDLTGIAFSDTFPAGLQVANPLTYNIAPECGTNAIFSPTLVAGAFSLALQGVDLAHGAACTVSVNVTPTSMPTKHNTTGIITSNESGPGTTSNTASLRAIVPPIISKAFSAATVPLNIDYRTLTFTLVNPNPLTSLSGVEFTDTFPAGLAVWNVPTVSTSGCGAPTFDPVAGDTSLTFSNGTIPAVSTCTISVRVVGTTKGTKNNTTSVVDSIEGGTGITSNTASLVVVAPPVIAKVFSPDSIKLGGSSTLTFTITNPNTDSGTSLTGVGFTDSLPAGLLVADLPAAVITGCGPATFSPVAADTVLTISAATVEPGIDCVISVDLLAQTIGIKNNISSVVDSDNGGSGNTASDTLSVNLSPTVSKVFVPDTILINHTSTLTFTISNPNTSTDLTRIAFSDTFPAGLQVAAPLDAQIPPGCGKNATFSPGLVAGALSVSIQSVDLAHGASCTITVEVKATTRDTKDNTTGPITSYESEPGTTSNTAQINVDDPLLTLTKTLVSGELFDLVGDVLTYKYHLQNTGNVTLTGKGPAGIFSVLDDKATVDCPAGVKSLLPDETVDCTAVYRVSQNDLDHGSVTNIAHAVAYFAPFTLDVLSSEESVTVQAAQAPAINAINTASINPNIVPPANAINIGDLLTYSFSVTNPGNVSLSDIRVIGSKCHTPITMDKGRSRDLDGDKKLDVFIAKINEEIWVYECKHTLTQLELDAGKILNDIEVLGKSPVGTDVSTTSSLETSLLEVPVIGLAKRVVGDPQKVSPGVWDVTYEFNIHNYGNVTLHNLQISDDLSKAFTIPENLKEIVKTPTEFSVRSLTSPDFAVNWPGYNGKTQLDLLKNATINSNQITSGEDARVIMVVRVTPTFSNPLNTARVVGFSPINVEKSDISQNGIDPDPEPKDGDPTNNNQPTPVTFAAHVFDPPYGIKTLDASGDPVFRYSMVWINDTNIVPVYVEVSDGVPLGTEYIDNGIITTGILPSGTLPAGSVASGVSCVPASEGTTSIYCYFEGPTLDYPRGRIVWRGTIGPDLGIKIPSFAKNAITITFDLLTKVDAVENIATLDMLDPFERFFTNASSSWTRKMRGLPVTGFPLDRVTLIPQQPKSARYTDLKDLWLDIPTLGIHADIVGVPEDGAGSWETSWLGDRVGYLAGSTFPTWVGNSVLTGHVWDANNQPGIFAKLKLLKYGDRFTIQAYGQTFTYEVRETSLVMPNDIAQVMEQQANYSWVTLLTCEGFNETDKSYTNRRMIRAVLISEK